MKKLKKNRFGVPVYCFTKSYYSTLVRLRNCVDRLLDFDSDGDITKDLLDYNLWTIKDCVKCLNKLKPLKSSKSRPNIGTIHTIYNFGHTGKDVTLRADIDNNITCEVSDFDPNVLPF